MFDNHKENTKNKHEIQQCKGGGEGESSLKVTIRKKMDSKTGNKETSQVKHCLFFISSKALIIFIFLTIIYQVFLIAGKITK